MLNYFSQSVGENWIEHQEVIVTEENCIGAKYKKVIVTDKDGLELQEEYLWMYMTVHCSIFIIGIYLIYLDALSRPWPMNTD